MNPQVFAKMAGIVQALLGVAGAAAPGAMGNMMGAQMGGSGFNILSGALLSYLGFKGTAANQQLGAQALGVVNLLVGAFGAFGLTNIAGIPLNTGTLSTAVNIVIGLWGLAAGFLGKKKA